MLFLRMLLILFVVEALFYVLLSIYVRSLRREKLEDIWDRRHPLRAGDNRERKEFVRRSMAGFEKTLRARLVGLVFVVPTVAVAIVVYIVNSH